MIKHNLFDYATSELSQDAFICWLISFADDTVTKDLALKECAKEMLEIFVPELKGKKYTLLNIERQFKNIDILITVECRGVVYKIIVEDKTFTSEHDSQLEDYKNTLNNIAKDTNKCFNIRCVYFKTGFQSNVEAVLEAGYIIVDRKIMLNTLRPYVHQTQNDIFLEYYESWNTFQIKTEQYMKKTVDEWEWYQIYGFYDYLHDNKHTLIDGNSEDWYGYVSNPNGGFQCFSLIPHNKIIFKVNDIKNNKNITLDLFVQIEFYDNKNIKVCLKMLVNTDDKGIIQQIHNYIDSSDIQKAMNNYGFTRPKRFVGAKSMTIGIYNINFNIDYKLFVTNLKLAYEQCLKFIDYLDKQ